jgi:hypothetical protein
MGYIAFMDKQFTEIHPNSRLHAANLQ